MQFEENVKIKRLGEKVGFFVSLFLFTSIFYLILGLLHKIPIYVKYVHIVTGIVIIYFLGLIFKELFGK